MLGSFFKPESMFDFLGCFEEDSIKSVKWGFLLSSRLNMAEKAIFKYWLIQKIPEWAYLSDSDINRFKLAMALSVIDSRHLSEDVRSCLGLSPKFEGGNSCFTNPPKFPPYDKARYFDPTLCTESYERLLVASEGGVTFVCGDCLIVKTYGICSGVCTELTEFHNGAVFVPNIWYVLRGHFPEGRAVLDSLRTRTELYKKNGYTPAIVNLPNIGGIWEPAKPFLYEEYN